MRKSSLVVHLLGCALLGVVLSGCQGGKPWQIADTWWKFPVAKGSDAKRSLAAKPAKASPAGKWTVTDDETVMASPAEAQIGLELSLAEGHDEQGQTAEAIAGYQRVVARDPKRSAVWHRLAVLHDQQGECAQAVVYYRKALELSPRNADLLADFGYNCYLRQQWKESESSLRAATAADQNHRRAFNNLGLLLARTGRIDEARAAFAQGGCSPAETHTNLALVLALSGEWSQAEEHCALAATDASLHGSARKQQSSLHAALRNVQSSNAQSSNAQSIPASFEAEGEEMMASPPLAPEAH